MSTYHWASFCAFAYWLADFTSQTQYVPVAESRNTMSGMPYVHSSIVSLYRHFLLALSTLMLVMTSPCTWLAAACCLITWTATSCARLCRVVRSRPVPGWLFCVAWPVPALALEAQPGQFDHGWSSPEAQEYPSLRIHWLPTCMHGPPCGSAPVGSDWVTGVLFA